jgi:hypothetical protein
MAIKVLVNAVGQHIVADAKQVEEKETKKIIAYLLTNPRVASYTRDDAGNINVGFAPYCVLSDEAEFTIRAENIVAILEPRADVSTQYEQLVAPKEEAAEEETVVAEAEPVAAEETEAAAV